MLTPIELQKQMERAKNVEASVEAMRSIGITVSTKDANDVICELAAGGPGSGRRPGGATNSGHQTGSALEEGAYRKSQPTDEEMLAIARDGKASGIQLEPQTSSFGGGKDFYHKPFTVYNGKASNMNWATANLPNEEMANHVKDHLEEMTGEPHSVSQSGIGTYVTPDKAKAMIDRAKKFHAN